MLTMYDSVTVIEIPLNAAAVAGYTSGIWPTYATLVTRFPKAKKLSIAVDARHDADCLDIERGDASTSEAPGWVRRQIARGVRPVVYTSVSNAVRVIDTLAKAGFTRGQYRLWTAHYTHHPHLCGPECGFGFRGRADATQYTDRALGRNLDASLCSDTFFAPRPRALSRRRLRAKILRWRKKGVSWPKIKSFRVWWLWRKADGK